MKTTKWFNPMLAAVQAAALMRSVLPSGWSWRHPGEESQAGDKARRMKANMRMAVLAAGVLVVLLLAGCKDIISLYPFYHERDLVDEPALAGRWVDAEKAATEDEPGEFKRVARGTYVVGGISTNAASSSSLETNAFEVHVFRLKTGLFMDWIKPTLDCDCPSVPAHSLWKVKSHESELVLQPMDYDWLRAYLTKHPDALRHILLKPADTNSDILLTANTAELQHFLTKQEVNAGLFATNAEIRLVTPERRRATLPNDPSQAHQLSLTRLQRTAGRQQAFGQRAMP